METEEVIKGLSEELFGGIGRKHVMDVELIDGCRIRVWVKPRTTKLAEILVIVADNIPTIERKLKCKLEVLILRDIVKKNGIKTGFHA